MVGIVNNITKNRVLTTAITISDLYYTIIMAKVIHDNDIIELNCIPKYLNITVKSL